MKLKRLFLKKNGKTARGRFLIWAACVLLFVWFALPVPIYGVLNVGNLCGMAGAFACGAAALLFHRLAAFTGRLWKKKPGRAAVLAVCVIPAAGVLIAAGLGTEMVKAALNAPQGNETVIVLGCQVRGTQPSLMLSRRIAAAKAYLDAHPDAPCVLAGGQGEDEEISEARCMYNALTAAGIDPARLYLEDQSTSTAENIAFSRAVTDENGLPHDVALVTDGFHQFRAGRNALKLFDRVAAVNAKTPVVLFPTYVVREMAAFLFHQLFGTPAG